MNGWQATARARSMRAHPAGKGIPESDEVAQARMDDEAMQVANSNRPVPFWSTAFGQAVGGFALGLGFAAVVVILAVAAAIVEGVPL